MTVAVITLDWITVNTTIVPRPFTAAEVLSGPLRETGKSMVERVFWMLILS